MPILTRQTQSYLKNLFASRGLSPRHRLGQNFLIDLNILELIVQEGCVGPDDLILEIGPGAGALTALMAGRGASVLAFELDPELAKIAAETVREMPAARILSADALANKNTLNAVLVEHLQREIGLRHARGFKLISNLPYAVATPIVTNLLVHPELCPALMVVTIQRELAERMIAAPATTAYGALSVLVQGLAELSIVRILPPSVFWPRPKVESAIVAIRPRVDRRMTPDVFWFHRIVRQVFLHRRKNLRHVLAEMWLDRWTKADVDVLLEPLSIDGRLRAEALDVNQFQRLATALKGRWGDLSADAPDPPRGLAREREKPDIAGR
jgi:16S rRNA (adenine1518-N6/adenine1519-N6)-dimethyltransferase